VADRQDGQAQRADQPQAAAEQPRKGQAWKYIVGGAVIVLALLWLVLFVTVGGDYFRTVDEAKAAGSVQNGRVGGTVVEGSLVQNGDQVKFTIEGPQGARMNVVYNGSVPARLGPYEQVVVAGSTAAGGAFEATQVLVKCPEKLLPEKVTNKVLTGTGLERLVY
jgi:cytochrome c-type biogenesis protein CcmE